MGKTAIIALGGNAIIKAGQNGSVKEQFENTFAALDGIVNIIEKGYRVVITHGNGPQVGNLLRQQEMGLAEGISPLPLGLLNAATQGTMGFMIAQSLRNKLALKNVKREVLCLICEVEVDYGDPAFKKPSKFVGSRYYTAGEARDLTEKQGWTLKEDSGKGYRRVVPSPLPKSIISAHSIRQFLDEDKIIIAAGGGGVPVCKDTVGLYQSVDAVIDKDFASALLARQIGADIFVILTGVDKVAINFGQADMQALAQLNVKEALRYHALGHFPAGSMGPKILAAVDFLEGGGEKVIISSAEKVEAALEGRSGTVIWR